MTQCAVEVTESRTQARGQRKGPCLPAGSLVGQGFLPNQVIGLSLFLRPRFQVCWSISLHDRGQGHYAPTII
jgi:hypothetical protein